jgi:hypothetical protein
MPGCARNSRPRADQLLFVVDRGAKRTPETKRIHFPALLGKARDRRHASIDRWVIATNLASCERSQASPKEIEAAPFKSGCNVARNQKISRCGYRRSERARKRRKLMEASAAYCEPSDARNIVELANRKRSSSSDLVN